MTGGGPREDEETWRRVCCLCGLPVPHGVDACPHCGNVFSKNKDDWEWRFVEEPTRSSEAGEVAKKKRRSD